MGITKEQVFMRYLDCLARPGYGADLFKYDPECFYRKMRRFYSGRIGEI